MSTQVNYVTHLLFFLNEWAQDCAYFIDKEERLQPDHPGCRLLNPWKSWTGNS
jgi:hypothetical protein